MERIFNEKSAYIDILNRIHKKKSKYEGIFIIKKRNFTDNSFYYFLCILTRFLYLISFFGNYSSSFTSRYTNFKSFQQYVKNLLAYNIFNQIQIPLNIYIFNNNIIYIIYNQIYILLFYSKEYLAI